MNCPSLMYVAPSCRGVQHTAVQDVLQPNIAGGGEGGGGGTHFIQVRSLTLDPRIPVMPGRNTSDFYTPR